MTRTTTHYTNFGVARAPSVADASGYIPYRPEVTDALKRGEERPDATRAERWIVDQERRIDQWRVTGEVRS